MAVEAAPATTVPIPQNCICSIYLPPQPPLPDFPIDLNTTSVCASAGGKMGGQINGQCEVDTLSAYTSFNNLCTAQAIDIIHGFATCEPPLPDVVVPQACICENPTGVNTTAQTQAACGDVKNTGTMVNGWCVVESQDQYAIFTWGCPALFPGSSPTCEAQ